MHTGNSCREQAGVRAEALEGRTLLSGTSAAVPVIDLMVLYTPAAVAGAGGAGAIDAQIRRAVADTNVVFANSAVNGSLRLVHEQEVAYSESGVLATDLSRLQNPSDGFMDSVPALRRQFGADLVCMVAGSGDDAGRAFQPDNLTAPDGSLGYGVVLQSYLDDDYIFAHEIGHNLGAGHDPADTSLRSIPYAYGHVFHVGNETVGDVMSNGVTHAPYYSNPQVSFRGVSTGIPLGKPGEADNALVVNQFAPIVANYEPTVVPDSAPPAAALGVVTVDAARQDLSFQVRYADDSAVSASSLSSGDVVVTDPHGWTMPASLVDIDYPSDGAQRVATYQVSLAAVASLGSAAFDPGSYSFSLRAGRIADVTGHVSPGGPLGPSLAAPGLALPAAAGPRLATAMDVGDVLGTRRLLNDAVSFQNPGNFYRFRLSAAGTFSATLSAVSPANVNLLLVQDKNVNGQWDPGEILAYPAAGWPGEKINVNLAAGTYYLWAAQAGAGAATSYSLRFGATDATAAPPAPVPAPAGSIQGTVFDDLNDNGSRAATDPPLAGRRVFLDTSSDGAYEPGEPTTLSDTKGNYQFSNLTPGTYTVREVMPAGWRRSAAGAFTVAVAAGGDKAGLDFGNTTRALVAGRVYDDLNGNGAAGKNEPGLPGFRVFLDLNGTGTYARNDPSALTGASGDFLLRDLAPGAYTLRVSRPVGYASVTPANGYSLTLTSGAAVTGKVFAEKPIAPHRSV